MAISPSHNPVLSAVVCTHNRADLLRQTLESLSRQTLKHDSFEVVLIDDGSSDDTRDVARAFELKLPLRYSHQRNAGLASARNHGLFLARGDILLFLDDDDVAHSDLLETHCDSHRRFPQPHYGVLGFTQLDRTIASDPLMHFVTQVGCFLFSYPRLQDGDVLDFSYFWGGRCSCKRTFLLEHGVFNPVFRFGCEDIELAFRLSRHGFKVVYNPRAVSTMVRRVGYDDFCWRLFRQGQSNFVFTRLHEDAVVQQCTEVAGAKAVWGKVGPLYDAIVRSGRELDRIVRRRLGAGLAVDEQYIALLHRGYWTAFRLSKVKGIVDRMAEMGDGLVAAAVPPPLHSSAESAENHLEANSYSSAALSSFLAAVPAIHGGGSITWGLAEDTLRFIDANVTANSRTLETGAGVSTLLFTYKGAEHTCITPFRDEVERLQDYCDTVGVSTARVSFVVEKSQVALPCLHSATDLDLILIDGSHGFPVPFLDWFLTASKLKVGGLVIVEDTQLWTGATLRDFLRAEPEWRLEATFFRGAAFRKLADHIEKEWNEQPFVCDRSEWPGRPVKDA